MKRKFATTYAVFCTLLLVAGFLLAFYFAWERNITAVIFCLIGLCSGFILSPIIHELGHITFAKANGMRVVYAKFFCFKFAEKDGKLRFLLASPFTPDCTQVLPLYGGNMQKRASRYTLGGLIFSGIFFIITLAVALVCSALDRTSFFAYGVLPYAGYLFLLNALPVAYASGKTDALVYKGLKNGYDAEKTMLSAMEIQGGLSSGNSFAEMDERLYYDLPVLCEDEPLFAVMLDLRYRYHLEKGEMQKAKKALDYLASLEAYLSQVEIEKIATELVYMHALNDNIEGAEANASLCKEFLQGDSATAKRVLATFALAVGKKEEAKCIKAQGERALDKERVAGVKKFESVLLARIKMDENEKD